MEEIQKSNIKTYSNLKEISENKVYTLIDGTLFLHAAPSWQHQKILKNLMLIFGNYLKDKDCEIFSAPFDVFLEAKDEIDVENATTVVQPDLTIICDKSKLAKTGYIGAPKMIIEITSPSTVRLDRVLKFNKYEEAGVKEYWVLEPENKIITCFVLQSDGRYGRPKIFSEGDIIKVATFPDLEIHVNEIFEI
ncbi:Uma2 family endonuclease [Caldicellulosiruptor changbaiensis]|uniref:Uma2 family endonuclease n=1 Tax=Caldicellulosiruptor changbaiensis TaxID=1222016 RepID=A0A3T0D937_9FIRM|nr:Uma2 family endonuclease [Caldicellulosiruptor changbaiensis]AZT91554.1 Uma2 family endonuclease [Caldicellulosiruptor changbaiensis]